MWCTTECWNCEDKSCEHYFSKQDIYFKYKQLQSNWNSLREWLEEKTNEDWDFSTGERNSYEAYDNVLDKMNELESKNV